MNQDNTKSGEIDVLALLHKLWTKKLLILFTAFYFAAFSFLGTYFFIQPTYTSTTRIYVVNQATDNKNLSAQDLQAGTYCPHRKCEDAGEFIPVERCDR